MKFTFLFTALALISSTAMAQFLSEGTLTQVQAVGDYFAGGAGSRGHIYVIPNEVNPENAISILNKAPTGVYISVGAERGLIGAALSPRVTHLVQVDLVPEVVLYNQLNVVLLKVAQGMADFIHLRQAPQSEWVARANTAGLNTKERELLMAKDSHEFYLKVEGAARERLVDTRYFQGSSYLKEPELFERVQSLARQNRIQVLQGNLTDTNRLRGIGEELAARGLAISVFDMSNAWEPKYIGPKGVDLATQALSPALRPESILIATNVAHSLGQHISLWDFRGFTMDLLEQGKHLVTEDPTMSGLVGKKDLLAPNRLLTKLNLWKLYVSRAIKGPSTIRSCQAVFMAR